MKRCIQRVTRLGLAAATLLGCRAAPAPDSGFLREPHKMARHEQLPTVLPELVQSGSA